MKVLQLPSDCFISLFTEWLEMKELGLFDTAMTNYFDMIKFRREISSKQFVHSGSILFNQPILHAAYYKWLLLREIAVKEVILNNSLDISELSRFFKIQEQYIEMLVLHNSCPILELLLPSFLSQCCSLQEIWFAVLPNSIQLPKSFKALPNPSLLQNINFCLLNISLATLCQISLECKCIESLALKCVDIDRAGIDMEPHFSNITKLLLKSVHDLNDAIFCWFMQSCQRLEVVGLTSCNVTKIGVDELLKFTITLRKLVIEDVRTTYDDIASLIAQCDCLEAIQACLVGDCINILQTIAHNGLNLNAFCIKEFGTKIPINLIMQLIPTFTNMTSCMLLNVQGLDDSFLYSVVDNCPNLTTLAANYANFSNEAIIFMARCAKNLSKVDIRGSHIDDNTLYQLSKHDKLSHIGICCEKLTIYGYSCIALGFLNLIKVHFCFTRNPPDKAIIDKLKQTRPKVMHAIHVLRTLSKLFEFVFE